MYTIIMNDDKSLRKGETVKIYQREKLVDKLQFLLPLTYQDFDLSDFTVTLKYVDQGNVAHAEILVPSEQLYQNTRRVYYLPVDTKLTKFAGTITGHLTLSKLDLDTDKQYVLHTGKTTIVVSPLEDLYAFVADESLEVLDRKMLELEAKIQATDKLAADFESNQVDDLMLTGDLLQLSANDEPRGDGVRIVVQPKHDGDFDGVSDGLLDLDNVEPDAPEEDGFIDLDKIDVNNTTGSADSSDKDDGFIEL